MSCVAAHRAGQGLLSGMQFSEVSVTTPFPLEVIDQAPPRKSQTQTPGAKAHGVSNDLYLLKGRMCSCAYQGQLPGCATCATAQVPRLEGPSLL